MIFAIITGYTLTLFASLAAIHRLFGFWHERSWSSIFCTFVSVGAVVGASWWAA
jgi:hypothetical protein